MEPSLDNNPLTPPLPQKPDYFVQSGDLGCSETNQVKQPKWISQGGDRRHLPKKRILKVKQPNAQAIEDQQKQLEKMVRQLDHGVGRPQLKLSPIEKPAYSKMINTSRHKEPKGENQMTLVDFLVGGMKDKAILPAGITDDPNKWCLGRRKKSNFSNLGYNNIQKQNERKLGVFFNDFKNRKTFSTTRHNPADRQEEGSSESKKRILRFTNRLEVAPGGQSADVGRVFITDQKFRQAVAGSVGPASKTRNADIGLGVTNAGRLRKKRSPLPEVATRTANPDPAAPIRINDAGGLFANGNDKFKNLTTLQAQPKLVHYMNKTVFNP